MNWFQRVFYIKSGTDYEETAASIASGIHARGVNVWLMICSALLASIGLDTNSTAVIIGAMLISPLMSPILGAGYSVGVQDRELFIKSVQNLTYITVFSLLTSVIYFRITPLGEPTGEILARTQPTVLDIGVAFFGGVAGIVSASRKEKTNALPGVAIATALMPPLCAAGFGLATGRWEIFGGAFYLFFINAVFIAWSTYLIVRLLKFPSKTYVDKVQQKRIRQMATIILILISVPSFWFLYSVYQKNRTRKMIQSELISRFKSDGNEILKWETEDQDSIKLVKTFYSGNEVTNEEANYYNRKLVELGLSDYRARFFRMNLSRDEMNRMGSEMTANIIKTVELKNAEFRDSLKNAQSNRNAKLLYEEVNALFPKIKGLGLAELPVQGAGKADTIWTALIQWDSTQPATGTPETREALQRFLKKRLAVDSVLIQHAQ